MWYLTFSKLGTIYLSFALSSFCYWRCRSRVGSAHDTRICIYHCRRFRGCRRYVRRTTILTCENEHYELDVRSYTVCTVLLSTKQNRLPRAKYMAVKILKLILNCDVQYYII